MVDASFYQMMRGSIVVITAILSIIFLNRKLFRHHWTGIIVLVLGICIVGWAASSNPNKPDSADSDDNNYSLGIILLLAAKCCSGGMFIAEEKIFAKY